MLFPTLEFAIFFALVLPAVWALNRSPRAWRWLLLAASYLFYGWWDWRFLGLIGASSLVNQWLGVALHRAGEDQRRRLQQTPSSRQRAGVWGLAGAFPLWGGKKSGQLRAPLQPQPRRWHTAPSQHQLDAALLRGTWR